MRAAALAPFFLASAVVVASCTSILGDFKPPGSGGTGGDATTAQSSTHATSGSGGAGGGPTTTTTTQGQGGGMGCTTSSDCPAPHEFCKKATCDAGFCGVDFSKHGTPSPFQVGDDCATIVCDNAGNFHAVLDSSDSDDGNPCTADSCNGIGMPVHEVMSGLDCGGGNVCNDAGQCVECRDHSDCPSGGACDANGDCQPATCSDGIKNQDETDIDCGGGCGGCALGKACKMNGDCNSTFCQQLKCRITMCGDLTKNGTETDIDCGGTACAPCGAGKACLVTSDCASGLTCPAATLTCQ